jgi:hypothetical protein
VRGTKRVPKRALAALVSAVGLLTAATFVEAAPPPSSYPSCGVHRTGSANPFVAPLKQYVCLLQARRSGTKARAVIVSSTIEGDPIVTYLFVDGRLPVLVVVDATRDDFGPRVWLKRRCEVMELRDMDLALGRCRALPRGKPAWLKTIRLHG